MASLVVRNLDRWVIEALRRRAARHGRSVEAEHRAILETTLLRARRRTFAEALAAMPNVGRGEDFGRTNEPVLSVECADKHGAGLR